MSESPEAYLTRLRQKLGPYLSEYAKPTIEERQEKRLTAVPDELVESHRVISAELDGILEVLDRYAPDAVPAAWRDIANAVLCLAEIDSPVVKWIPRFGLAHLPDALDPRHFESKKNFYDVEPSRGRTLMSERIR